MQIIPITATASQSFSVQLGGQQCAINIYQKSTGLFFDLSLNGAPIVSTKLCLNCVSLVQGSYLGFVGTLIFVDMQGTSDPYYTGLGSRYILVYNPLS